MIAVDTNLVDHFHTSERRNDQGTENSRRENRRDLPAPPGEETLVRGSGFLVVSEIGL